MSEFTLRQLKYFVTAAEVGTLRLAAEKLFVSPSTVSSAITELEQALGERLCIRRQSYGLSLTPGGEVFFREARKVVRDVENLRYALGRNGELRGPLHIGCYPSLSPVFFSRVLSDFPRQHPGIDLSILEASQDELLQRMSEGHVDLSIMYDFELPDDLEYVRLFDLRPYVLLSTEHPLATRDAVSLTELAPEPFILMNMSPSVEHTYSVFREAGAVPHILYQTSKPELVKSLVAKNVGYSIRLQPIGDRLGNLDRRLAMLPLTPEPSALQIVVAWPRGVRPSERAQAMLDFIVAHRRDFEFDMVEVQQWSFATASDALPPGALSSDAVAGLTAG